MLKNRGFRMMCGLALALMLAATLVACGGDTKDDKTASTTGDNEVSGARTKLDDCAYARQLNVDIGRFASSLPDTSTASISSTDQALQALDTLDTELGTFITQMKGYRLSGDVAKVNTAFIGFFEEFRTQLPAVRASARSGDIASLERLSASFGEDLDTKLETILQNNQEVFDKLSTCQL